MFSCQDQGNTPEGRTRSKVQESVRVDRQEWLEHLAPLASDGEIDNVGKNLLSYGSEGYLNYMAAIGYAYKNNRATHKRIFVTDNGYTTDRHQNYPYWSICGGLHYILEKH